MVHYLDYVSTLAGVCFNNLNYVDFLVVFCSNIVLLYLYDMLDYLALAGLHCSK